PTPRPAPSPTTTSTPPRSATCPRASRSTNCSDAPALARGRKDRHVLFDESDCLPLSALQHLRFCERQCALIHVEGLWAENRLTVEGRHLHERVDAAGGGGAAAPAGQRRPRKPERVETRGGVRTVRSLPLRSLRLGLIGKADTVEFHPA